MRKETGKWKSRWKIRDLLADERCSRAVLDFLTSTDVGRRVPAEKEDTVSEVSEAELREWAEEQGAGTEEPGAGGKLHFSFPRLTSWHPQERASPVFFCPFSFVLSFVISLVRFTSFLGQAWAEGKGELATCRHCAQETDCT